MSEPNSAFVDHSIIVWRKAFDPTQALSVIQSLPEPYWTASTYEDAVKDDVRKCDNFYLSLMVGKETEGPLKAVDQTMLATFCKVIEEYKKSATFLKIDGDEGFIVLRYKEGNFIDEHADRATARRILSGLIYLNDDFEGGELIFPRQNLTIKPEAGMVVMFPASFAYPHRVTTVFKGTRYSVVSWFYGEVLTRPRT
jgi:prolyl 4-hydroxylase